MTRFLIIGDLHGQMPHFSTNDFDAIIAPGDFCSDKNIREVFMKMYRNYVKDVNNYQDWWDLCGRNKAKKYTEYSLAAGRKILKQLNSYNKPVFLVPGNWDWAEREHGSWIYMNQDFWKKLKSGLKNIHDIDGKIKTFQGITFIGYGRCNGPELLTYRSYGNVSKHKLKKNNAAYKKLLAKESELFKKAKNPIIYLTHNVPYNTKLDIIKNKKSPMDGKHYGSNLAREMIEKHQPLVCIGGHMHEHFGKDNIKKTTIINSGFGRNVNTLLEIVDGKIGKLEFYERIKV
ncbi:MAG: metallophosphoesterase [Candidatus Woesearchaeota archaeon]